MFSFYPVGIRCRELPPDPLGVHAEDRCHLEQLLLYVPTPAVRKNLNLEFQSQCLHMIDTRYQTKAFFIFYQLLK